MRVYTRELTPRLLVAATNSTPSPPMKLVVLANNVGSPTIIDIDERPSMLFYTDEMDSTGARGDACACLSDACRTMVFVPLTVHGTGFGLAGLLWVGETQEPNDQKRKTPKKSAGTKTAQSPETDDYVVPLNVMSTHKSAATNEFGWARG